ncbi:YheC/YheD family endospore coat-associated protein [Robertmurraya korlensis]|uniref:YheC/YheD family endospore coat-associated protein n=1 Tax=Robertmurraya korlensis TaxID=519977 RepID=UPI000824EB67|nr:YheC/YheD family protein [Robertmurraya korlensis]
MHHIKPCNQTQYTITLSPDSPLIPEQPNVSLLFGVKTAEVKIEVSDSVEGSEILLSDHLIHELQIPLTCSYDILVGDHFIRIGPFIGILAELTDKKVEQLLFTYKSFVRRYQQIGGAILVFSLESIHIEQQTISGFLYQPEHNSWKYGTFPFPASVMTILEASLTSKYKDFHQKINVLTSVLGPKVFNYPHFSKWEMHKLLVQKLGHVLPETTLYQEPDDITDMLKLYKSIYIKPINGRLGKRIFKVVQTNKHIAVYFYVNRRKQVKTFSSPKEMMSFFQANLVPNVYLIQQTISLMKFDDRIIDFRVMMIKNEWGIWDNLGIYSRYGAKGQLVSNITAGGQTELASDTLKTVWKLDSESTQEVLLKIDKLVREALELFEQQGYHLANIGFDIGMNENGALYIIEINHQNPDPYIALKANNSRAFYLARYKNMMYAKHLEGY